MDIDTVVATSTVAVIVTDTVPIVANVSTKIVRVGQQYLILVSVTVKSAVLQHWLSLLN